VGELSTAILELVLHVGGAPTGPSTRLCLSLPCTAATRQAAQVELIHGLGSTYTSAREAPRRKNQNSVTRSRAEFVSWHFPRWSDSALGTWKNMILKRGWQAVGVFALWMGCAGDLKEPGRFAFLYDKDGGAADSGTSSGSMDAGGSSSMDAATTTTPPAAAPMCVTALFMQKCGSLGCHAKGGTQVDLVSANVADRLVGKPSSSSLLCKGRTLVSASGGASLLIDKITDPPPCGSLMPVTGSLTAADRTCLTGWVSSLADSN
jgi:hypothetical protein